MQTVTRIVLDVVYVAMRVAIPLQACIIYDKTTRNAIGNLVTKALKYKANLSPKHICVAKLCVQVYMTLVYIQSNSTSLT